MYLSVLSKDHPIFRSQFQETPTQQSQSSKNVFHFPTAATQHVAKAIHTYLGKIHWCLHGETMTLHHNCTQASKAGKLLKGQDTKIPWENPGDPGNVDVFS